MKIKNLTIALVVVLGLAFTSSCKNDEGQIVVASMSATIDGTAWSCTPAAAVGTTFSEYTTIAGYNLGGQYILISVRGTTAGTYTFAALEGETNTYAVYMEDKDAAESELDKKKYVTVSGEVVITSIEDGKINGTFNFAAANSVSDQIQIAGGVFNNVPLVNGSN